MTTPNDVQQLLRWGLGILSSLIVTTLIAAATLITQQRQDMAVLKSEFANMRETNTQLRVDMRMIRETMAHNTGEASARIATVEKKVDEVDDRVSRGFGAIEEQLKSTRNNSN